MVEKVKHDCIGSLVLDDLEIIDLTNTFGEDPLPISTIDDKGNVIQNQEHHQWHENDQVVL